MKIIGLVGPKGSGKDASAKILKDEKISSGKLSFAGPLKTICSEVFDVPMRLFIDPVLKEKDFAESIKLDRRNLKKVKLKCASLLPEMNLATDTRVYNIDKASISGLEGRVMKSPRELLQIIGTEFIRNQIFGEWHMRAAFSDQVLEGLKPEGLYCVTDVRFPNEFSFLSDKFGVDFQCFYIERPEAEARLVEATHPSETEVLNIKELLPESNIIDNSGSLADLKAKLLSLELSGGGTSSEDKGVNIWKKSKFKFAPR